MPVEVLFVIDNHPKNSAYWFLEPVGDVPDGGPVKGISLPKEPWLIHKKIGDTIVANFSDDYSQLQTLTEVE